MLKLEEHLNKMKKTEQKRILPDPKTRIKKTNVYIDVKKLIEIANQDLEPVEFGRAWLHKMRKIQIEILDVALVSALSNLFTDDNDILFHCKVVLEHSDTGWFYSKYNYFHQRLDQIVTYYHRNPDKVQRGGQMTHDVLNTLLIEHRSEEEDCRLLVEYAKSQLVIQLGHDDVLPLNQKLAALKIEGVTGEELLQALVLIVYKQINDRVKQKAGGFRRILAEQTATGLAMQAMYEALRGHIGPAYKMLKDYQQRHPAEFKELSSQHKLPIEDLAKLVENQSGNSTPRAWPEDTHKRKVYKHCDLKRSTSVDSMTSYAGSEQSSSRRPG